MGGAHVQPENSYISTGKRTSGNVPFEPVRSKLEGTGKAGRTVYDCPVSRSAGIRKHCDARAGAGINNRSKKMKKSVISMAASGAILALGMHAVMAADMRTNDSKIDQKPAAHSAGSAAPTPGWEKLQKNKRFKSTASGESGSMQSHHAAKSSKHKSTKMKKGGAAKPATAIGGATRQHGSPDMKTDSNVVPEGRPHPGM